jgi:hypothetical protein
MTFRSSLPRSHPSNVVHARRTDNNAAHACAKAAASIEFDVWANDPPNFLAQILHDDCNHISE